METALAPPGDGMTTTVFLVRHASHGHLGKTLTGRMSGIGLSDTGRAEARRAGVHLARLKPVAVYASPLERAQETAAIIAATLGLTMQPAEALSEIDFGAWTGRDFQSLDGDPEWNRWNTARSLHRPPGGESMLEVQVRVAAWLSLVIARHPDSAVVAVSHADVIKAAVAHVVGFSIDSHHRITIDPGSVTALAAGPWGVVMHSMNETPP